MIYLDLLFGCAKERPFERLGVLIRVLLRLHATGMIATTSDGGSE